MIEDAPADALPPILVDPPWEQEARKPKPARAPEPEPRLVPGLTPPDERIVAWLPGERAQWEKVSVYNSVRGEWEQAVQSYRDGTGVQYEPTQAGMFAKAPVELVRPLLAEWRPRYPRYIWKYLRPVVARFESDARGVVVHCAGVAPAADAQALLPFLDAEVAVLMADWLFRLKSARKVAAAWFGRHGLAAVPFLVPDALGKSRPARKKAVAALWFVAGEHGADAVAEAARAHGDEAAGAVAEVLRGEPPVTGAAKKPAGDAQRPPKLSWLDAAELPRLVLKECGRAVPPAAARNVVSLLSLSGARPHPGLAPVVEGCTPGSLAEFSWAVFEAWRAAGEPSRSGWVLHQLGWLGDDETVRRLTPIIRVWPGKSGHAKAVQGLNVLTSIGTDVALIHLNAIARKVKFTGLRHQARLAIAQAAKDRGLSSEQLADRLVPGLGLDAEGGMTLDYGPRAFRVGFDEQLKPYVMDGDGKRRKALPKPGVKDDGELAPAAYRRFADLKKDVRTIAAEQIERLETAMVTGRRWTSQEFRAFFVDHPLIWHIARRVVWLAGERPFRIAEDRTFADADDEPFTLRDTDEVGIAHPLLLGEALEAWGTVFADYEILQPFPQLGRTIHTLTDEERKEARLARFEGRTVPVGKVLGLTRHGWERGAPQDGGVEHEITLRVGPDRWIVVDLTPGIAVGAVDIFPEQTLAQVMIGTTSSTYGSKKDGPVFGDLDPVVASEVLSTLTHLTGN
ncbi:hypothetical protein GCM10023085_55080 [Actinomadura viridis]|uniref:DUF4132 domain-containing protein n=1 Tax=Actinomadura viridis TaxID=58110 RepID=A0A931DCF2_9ACTN|nr:DUF4132 domain-containing protein [Actinomadura viridis]MBG6086467.1 hypothetical protein [Actinomadura viridis]